MEPTDLRPGNLYTMVDSAGPIPIDVLPEVWMLAAYDEAIMDQHGFEPSEILFGWNEQRPVLMYIQTKLKPTSTSFDSRRDQWYEFLWLNQNRKILLDSFEVIQMLMPVDENNLDK